MLVRNLKNTPRIPKKHAFPCANYHILSIFCKYCSNNIVGPVSLTARIKPKIQSTTSSAFVILPHPKNTPRIPQKPHFLAQTALILPIFCKFCGNNIVWPASLTARILSLTKFYLITTFSATIAISAYFPTHLHKISQRSFPWKNLTVCVLPTTR